MCKLCNIILKLFSWATKTICWLIDLCSCSKLKETNKQKCLESRKSNTMVNLKNERGWGDKGSGGGERKGENIAEEGSGRKESERFSDRGNI